MDMNDDAAGPPRLDDLAAHALDAHDPGDDAAGRRRRRSCP